MDIFLQLCLQFLYPLLTINPLLLELLNRLLILEVLLGIDWLLFLQCSQFLQIAKVDDLGGFLDELDLGGCILLGTADDIVYVHCELLEVVEHLKELQVLWRNFDVVLVVRLDLGSCIEVSVAPSVVLVVFHG